MHYVIKRNGKKESIKFDKVTARIEKLSYSLSPLVNVFEVAKKVIEGIYDGVRTTELDNLAAETAASLATRHPDYALLASQDRGEQPAQEYDQVVFGNHEDAAPVYRQYQWQTHAHAVRRCDGDHRGECRITRQHTDLRP